MKIKVLLLLLLLTLPGNCWSTIVAEKRVQSLIQTWAPLVWLAPGERFLPSGVPEFLENMESDDNYLHTLADIGLLLQNKSSFLYGKKPAGNVPIYALVKNCANDGHEEIVRRKRRILKISEKPANKVSRVRLDEVNLKMIQTNDINIDESSFNDSTPSTASTLAKNAHAEEKTEKKFVVAGNKSEKFHFHVTYWMFYPFSEGKAVCVLDLGFLGFWPIPTFAGMCFGKLKEYGNHVGDWEHVSLYFKDKRYPLAMYVSAHDAGAFYEYDVSSGTFVYKSQETRKGIFQKPTFPERVYNSGGSHPILFSARGSHGLWTAPGKHKFVRIPRLYDESGFGTAWPTWKKIELLSEDTSNLSNNENVRLPAWMHFRGKWGNPKSNCHPLAKLGFDICEFVDGPTGIPLKKMNFQC